MIAPMSTNSFATHNSPPDQEHGIESNQRRLYVRIALGLLAIHALVLTVVHSPIASSDLLLDLCAGVACLSCYKRSRVCSGAPHWKWLLVAGGIFVWCIGQTLTAYNEGLLHLLQGPTAIDADFYFFLFGIPLLLAISSANEHKRSGKFLWIDGLQATLAIYLAHFQLFPSVSGSATQDAISSVRMVYAYDAENVILVCTAALRMVAKPQGEEKHLYRSLLSFLVTFGIVAAVLNALTVYYQLQTGTYFDLLWDIPFLLLAVLATSRSNSPGPGSKPAQTWAGLLVTNASPLFFSLGLLIMSVYVERSRPVLGISAMIFALLSYGIRNSLVQSHLMRTEGKLLESETALREANRRLEQISLLDGLTGVPNRRRFEAVLLDERNRATRTGMPLCLLVIDIDYFKLLNDRHGHLHGDACLVETARALSGCLRRAGELLARYGGEEFVAILPLADMRRASVVAEQMRLAVEQLSIPNEDAPGRKLTISIGIAELSVEDADHGADLFSMADQALYRAKSGGRNRVCLYGNEGSESLDNLRMMSPSPGMRLRVQRGALLEGPPMDEALI